MLEKHGHSTFNPAKDMSPGQDFRRTLQSEIANSDALLTLISSPSTASESWIGYEIGIAEALEKPVVTLASDRFSLSELPSDLTSRLIVNFDPQSPEGAARDVVERLSAVINAPLS